MFDVKEDIGSLGRNIEYVVMWLGDSSCFDYRCLSVYFIDGCVLVIVEKFLNNL